MFNASLRLIAVLAVAIGIVSATPSAGQGQKPQPMAELPSDAQLDALLAARKWDELAIGLSRARTHEANDRLMNWLGIRINAGDGFFLGFLYARGLWALGNRQKVDDPRKDMRVTAGKMALYTYELIAIDGAKCRDNSGPQSRLYLFMGGLRPVLDFLKSKSEQVKVHTVDAAIALEKRTAPLRKEDDVLCQGGVSLEDYEQALVGGKKPPSRGSQYLAPEQYRPIQEQTRSRMKAELLKLVK